MSRAAARFPAVAQRAGHYESFYVKASHPSEPLALWLRYTIHKRPGEAARGAVWLTLFDAARGAPFAVKEQRGEVGVRPGEYVHVGDSAIGPDRATGAAAGAGRSAAWELAIDTVEEPLHHLPHRWMYRGPIPRTKLESPQPDARLSGHVQVDGRSVALDGWRGVVGHNWGAEHAERWIWLHVAGFTEDDEAWLDVALGRIRLGPIQTPWIANGVLSLGGRRHRLGGPHHARRTKVDETPDRCHVVLPGGAGLSVTGGIRAPRERLVGWVYADPDGSEHHVVNCSIADLRLAVARPGEPVRELSCSGAAAYELGMRERDHGVALQPFPDG